jgi:hypothetical protein
VPRHYAFVTVWNLEAPVEAVWDAIVDVQTWPSWWPAVEAVAELAPGAEDGLGSVRRFTWRGRLPYALTFESRVTEVVRHQRLCGAATGELEGQGVWTFSRTPAGTRLQYDWHVRTAKWWMNAFAPLLEPVFRWNHDHVMRSGGEGLARWLRDAPARR